MLRLFVKVTSFLSRLFDGSHERDLCPLAHKSALGRQGPSAGRWRWVPMAGISLSVSCRMGYGMAGRGVRYKLKVRRRQKNSPKWVSLRAGREQCWGGRAQAELNSPAQSARPAPGPHDSAPTCPVEGSGGRSEVREGTAFWALLKGRTCPAKPTSFVSWNLGFLVCKMEFGL